jgi:hypothetical protein
MPLDKSILNKNQPKIRWNLRDAIRARNNIIVALLHGRLINGHDVQTALKNINKKINDLNTEFRSEMQKRHETQEEAE